MLYALVISFLFKRMFNVEDHNLFISCNDTLENCILLNFTGVRVLKVALVMSHVRKCDHRPFYKIWKNLIVALADTNNSIIIHQVFSLARGWSRA